MKRTIALLLGLLLCLAALTAAGSEVLISRSYLEGDFAESLEAAAATRLDASDAVIRSSLGEPVLPASDLPETTSSGGELTLKEGDVLSGPLGMTVTPLGGTLRTSGGAVIDVTAGTEIPGGGTLEAGHRYITAEGIDLTVASPTAVLRYEGGGSLTLSLTPDYYAAARALRSLALFKGTGTGFGEGFDLHLVPTRGEGLIMFLRILGEEEQALACTYTHPFTDVPAWLDRYVAWAYVNGYANGVSADRFGGSEPIPAVQYMEFLLRAMGYSTAGVDNYATSLERAYSKDVLNQAEYVMLRDCDFQRAHVAYMSWCALDVPVSGGEQTLAQRLITAGVMTETQLSAAREQAGTIRLE